MLKNPWIKFCFSYIVFVIIMYVGSVWVKCLCMCVWHCVCIEIVVFILKSQKIKKPKRLFYKYVLCWGFFLNFPRKFFCFKLKHVFLFVKSQNFKFSSPYYQPFQICLWTFFKTFLHAVFNCHHHIMCCFFIINIIIINT